MSGYGKAQQGDLLDYGASGGMHPSSTFGPYAQPPYASQLLFQSPVTDNPQDADQLHYVSSPEFAAEQQMGERHTPVIDQRFQQFPQVTSCSQLQGPHGSTVTVYIQSPHELRSYPRVTFSLLFASKRVDGSLQLISDFNVPSKQYAVSAQVPPFTSTGWHAFDLPLRMMMESDNTNISPLVVEVGMFSYANHTLPPGSHRKRRLSTESEDAVPHPIKKASVHLLPDERPCENGVYDLSAYSHGNQSANDSSILQTGYAREGSPRCPGHKTSDSVASAASIKAESPGTSPPPWSPKFTPVNQANPALPSSTISLQGSYVDAPGGSTPALIRTSTISHPPTSTNTVATSKLFNPYTIYPSKAALKLSGDLDSMVERWSLEEWDAKRRLVKFGRRQNGSIIHADFKAIAPEDRQPNSICISCIWWEEKKDFYVTSVDTIFLLESLVAVRFTVEEKNRIRRNLEGFRPLTVSKSKADSEEFFKIIMGFPNPKPRNIEKDVKVFPWKSLTPALKKIIGKYSASYSSTASALPAPAGSQYASNGASDSGTDLRTSASPQPNGINNGASPYSISTASFSPHVAQARVPAPMASGPPTDLRLQISSMGSGFSYPATQLSHHVPHNLHASRGSPQLMTAPPTTGRAVYNWDTAEYSAFGTSNHHLSANVDAYNYNRLLDGIPTSQGYVPSPVAYSIPQSGL